MKNAATKASAIALTIAVGLVMAGCEKARLDEQVRELCAKDGGIKVYEIVTLPEEKFDSTGNVRIPFKQHAGPSDEYFIETETVVLREGDPSLVRMSARVVRRSDEKVLGESIYYGRGGGDLPGPWHPSSFTCPNPAEKPYLEPSIFKKGEVR
ncbi:MAG: hypothetical protein KJ634_12120 [Gammaproteobacteria bacterium]|nr:hypothetical protein [Gammaproteobacteria bacterium]MBU1416361.1 hypothetical protein [Gammaproteobacteria bacterium]